MREHYTPAPVARPWASAALAVTIGLVLAVILVRYL